MEGECHGRPDDGTREVHGLAYQHWVKRAEPAKRETLAARRGADVLEFLEDLSRWKPWAE